MAISGFLLKAVGQVQEWMGVAAVLFLLHGALMVWAAGDSPSQRNKGWSQLAAVALGLIVVVFAKDLIRLLYSWAGAQAPF